MPIDPETYGRFNRSVAKARSHGMSLVEVLDRDRLLLTQARDRDIRVQALVDLTRRLEKQDIAKLLRFYCGRDTGTAAEAFRAVSDWIDVMIRAVADGSIEEVDDQANRNGP